MSTNAQSGKAASQPAIGGRARWVAWVALGLLVIVLVLLTPAGTRILRKGRAALLSLLPHSRALPSSGPLDLTIAFTNDTWGYVAPCGCRPPVGGVARRATLFKQIRSENENVLVLDAGNSLIAESATESDPSLRTQGQTSVEILNRMAYDAAAVGPIDLLLGRANLTARLSEAKGFNWLSANLTDPAMGKALAPSYVLKEIGGHNVALIGITGPITGSLTGRVPEFAVTDPLEAAQQTVQEVKSKADIIILLSSAGAQLNQKIGTAVPEIDIILSAGADALATPIQVPNGPLIVQADHASVGHAGRIVGILKASFTQDGTLTSHEWQAIPLDQSIADDPDIAAWVTSITAQ